MRYLKIIVLSIALVCSYIGSLSAQEMRYEKVDFKIKQVKIGTNIWNDTILNLKVEFVSREGGQLSLEGTGTLSLCYCYCDSIWDAWPEEIVGEGIPGTATIGYSSSGNNIGSSGLDGVLPTGNKRRRRGSFAIEDVQGGILEDGDEFIAPITFRLTN